jgi:indole-3-glycerol phosphate synthase
MDILQRLASAAHRRVAADKEAVSFENMKRQAESMGVENAGSFAKALSKPGLSFIAEVKKASPSKGIIAEDFDYMQIAADYAKAGADAISVLTEPEYFLGSDRYLAEIARQVTTPTRQLPLTRQLSYARQLPPARQTVRCQQTRHCLPTVPCLRKDFTIDAYQIYQAKTLGAAAILLIVSLLIPETLKSYIEIADFLGLDALVECHSEAEIDTAVRAGAKIIGVNNRDLKTFNVDTNTARTLRNRVPEGILFVSESGIKTDEDILQAVETGADAVLVGETLMRSNDKIGLLAKWRIQSTKF